MNHSGDGRHSAARMPVFDLGEFFPEGPCEAGGH
jgi:hypothetical protein